MAEKAIHLCLAHLSRMPLTVKQDESFDPGDICILGPDAVVPGTDCFSHLMEQLWFVLFIAASKMPG
jgi:hypothetical protein